MTKDTLQSCIEVRHSILRIPKLTYYRRRMANQSSHVADFITTCTLLFATPLTLW